MDCILFLWIGASAITVGIIFYLIPEISGTLMQLLIFAVLASSATYLAKKYLPSKNGR